MKEGTAVYGVISICQIPREVLPMLPFPHQPHEVWKWGLLNSRSNSKLLIFIFGHSAASLRDKKTHKSCHAIPDVQILKSVLTSFLGKM